MSSDEPVKNGCEVTYGFIAQLVRAAHRYREVTGSNPVDGLTFSGLYTQLLKLSSLLRSS